MKFIKKIAKIKTRIEMQLKKRANPKTIPESNVKVELKLFMSLSSLLIPRDLDHINIKTSPIQSF